MKRVAIILSIVLPATCCSDARAETIVEQLNATGVFLGSPGQSMTTPVGEPWETLKFNWFSDLAASSPTAFGTLFLLSQEYLGTAANLSPATPGYIAQSQGISASQYVLDPGVSIQPGTPYYLYGDTVGTFSIANPGPLVGGQNYLATSTNTFSSLPLVDAAFRWEGLVVPEPASTTLWALGAIGLAICPRRRK